MALKKAAYGKKHRRKTSIRNVLKQRRGERPDAVTPCVVSNAEVGERSVCSVASVVGFESVTASLSLCGSQPPASPAGADNPTVMGSSADEVNIAVSLAAQGSAPSPATHSLEGRRIVDIGHMFSSFQEVSVHKPFGCTLADMECVSEKRHGLRSSLTLVCRMCNKRSVIDTEPSSPRGAPAFVDVNTAAVSGITSIGCGFSNLSEVLGAMNTPFMSNRTFLKCQEVFSEKIEMAAWEMMKAAVPCLGAGRSEGVR